MTKKVAIICSTGGAGKTQLAVGLACTWSEQGHAVTLVDTDPQDTTSAKAWLDKIDEDDEATANLDYVELSTGELADHLDTLDTTAAALIIDTPPKLSDEAIGRIAEGVDLVVVPGNIGGDIEAVSQTAATIVRTTSTPCLIVLSRLESSQLAKSQDIAGDLLELGAGVASTRIRRYTVADEARVYGDVPTRLAGKAGEKHRQDLAGVAAEIKQRLGGF